MNVPAAARSDFFALQDQAKQRTAWLVWLFMAAVVLIILAVYAALAIIFQIGGAAEGAADQAQPAFFDPALLMLVGIIVLLIVGAGTLFQILRLSRGGTAVAEMLGGRPVDPSTRNPTERRLLNIVEEMAIASGVPPPRVYLLPDEPGINAFAAGYSTRDAVVAVTWGACNLLTRDELQGVVAHEFSHILQGDMRLNIRLMGILHGLLVLSLMGYALFRILGSVRSTGENRRGKDNSAALIMALALFGLIVMAIGYIGVFFGNMIKAAVSRQREFLADASAAQFTRNPVGLAGALKKIAGISNGSQLQATHASEASHLFFSNGARRAFAGLLATHPPLAERIRRLDPSFDGAIPQINSDALYNTIHAQAAAESAGSPRASFAPQQTLPAIPQIKQTMTDNIGVLNPAGLAEASSLLRAIPGNLREQVQTSQGALAALYALVLSPEERTRARQMQALAQIMDAAELENLRRTAAQLSTLGRNIRLPLAALAVQPLRIATNDFIQTVRSNLLALAQADNNLDLFEFALLRTVDKNLAPSSTPKRIRYTRKSDVASHAVALFSAIAHAGHANRPDLANASFQTAAQSFGLMPDAKFMPASDCGPAAIGPALDAMLMAAPTLKKALLDAAAAGASADDAVSPEEGELLRVIADNLDCPLPPLAMTA